MTPPTSRCESSGSSGESAFSASIASRACSRPRGSAPSFAKPSDAIIELVWTSRSEIFALRSSSTSCSAVGSSANALAELLGVDLLEAGALGIACELALGRVLRRNGEVGRHAELLRHGTDPLDQLLDPRARREGLPAVEIEELAGEPVPDRAPEVLLE